MNKLSCFVIVLTVISLTLGCNAKKKPDGMPDLIPFTVQVIQDGKPLEGANLMLKSDTVQYGVTGKTNASGEAILMTSKYEGAPAGEYSVTVKKEVITPSQYGNVTPPGDEEAAAWAKKRKSEYRPTHCYVAKKYGDFKTSGLKVSITGPGTQKIDVGSAVDDIIIPPDSAKKPK